MPEPSPELSRPQVTLKTVFTVCGGTLIVAAGVWAVINSLVAIGLTIAALLLAVALDHVVSLLTRHGFRRGWAIAAVMIALVGLLVGAGFVLIPAALEQGRQLVMDFVPKILPAVRKIGFIRTIGPHVGIGTGPGQLEASLARWIGGAGPILSVLSSALSLVAGAVTVLFLTAFILIFGGPLVRTFLAEARLERRATYAKLLKKIYASIGGYLGGLTVMCTINATVTTFFLWLNDVPFVLPLGLLAGLSSAIPYAGPAVVGTFIALVAAATVNIWHGIAAGIYFVAYGQLEGHVLAPLVFRKTTHMNPLVVILSILFFGDVAGIPGAVVAIPAVASMQIVLGELLRIRREHLNRLRAQQGKAPDPAPAG